MLNPMDCFDWHSMDIAPAKDEYVFVRKGEHVGMGKWERGTLTVWPHTAIACWPEAWASLHSKADLNT
jgi:hypothetical protein